MELRRLRYLDPSGNLMLDHTVHYRITDRSINMLSESNLRQTAVDEYFASGHEAAFIGR
jgi:hypothetical protein